MNNEKREIMFGDKTFFIVGIVVLLLMGDTEITWRHLGAFCLGWATRVWIR